MDENILLLPSKVISATAVPHEAAHRDLGGDAFVLVLATSVLLVGLDGKVKCTVNVRHAADSTGSKAGDALSIVAATYMAELCSVLLALSDASLVHVPLTMGSDTTRRKIASVVDAGGYERCQWPSQPVSLLALAGSTETQECVVRCAIGALAVIGLASPASSSSSSSGSGDGAPRCPSALPSELPGALLLHSLGADGTVSALLSASAARGSSKGKDAPAVRLYSWRKCKGWLTVHDSLVAAAPVAALQAGEQPHCMCTGEGGAVFVVLRSDASAGGKAATRWIKLIGNTGGPELFSRPAGEVEPVHVGFLGGGDGEGMLLLLGADGSLRSWCGRFGAAGPQWQSENGHISVPRAAPTPIKASSKRKASAMDASPSQAAEGTHYCLGGSFAEPSLHCVKTDAAGSTFFRIEITNNSGKISSLTGLARAVGCQRREEGEAADASVPLVHTLFATPEAGDADPAGEVSTPTGVGRVRGALGALARPLKRKLQQAAQWRAKFAGAGAELEPAAEEGGGDHEEGQDDRAQKRERLSDANDASRVAPQVPLEASTAFLRALKGRDTADILASDWDVLLTLLTAHRCVSVQHPNNSDLIEQALSAGRMDVLCCLARYAPDLTEVQAAQALVQVALWDAGSPAGQRALKSLRIGASGVLKWVPRHETAAPTSAPVASNKKGKQKAKVDKSQPVVVNAAAPEPQLIHLDVLRALSESLLRRNGAFSSTLLADAARLHVPSSAAAMLLQLFLLFLRGLCPGQSAVRSLDFQGFVHDVQVRRAVVWCEALLDAHFCDVALAMGAGSGTSALQSALRAAGAILPATGIAAGAVLAEEAMGMWTHVHRTARMAKERGSQHIGAVLSPPDGLYRLERIVF